MMGYIALLAPLAPAQTMDGAIHGASPRGTSASRPGSPPERRRHISSDALRRPTMPPHLGVGAAPSDTEGPAIVL
jgi:hypothetical protein